uniref:Uncharacterized protein n=1 Tax=Candidatus Kentrum sp. FW TaxID=2126338 RepID=A0A450RYY9_9GAMM|nr:MAG: hypothetical protein BECKFW1821A_GA0114235_100645 [Candidatus Kentron sp. FW]
MTNEKGPLEKETQATIGQGCAFCVDTGSGVGVGCLVCGKQEPPELTRSLSGEANGERTPDRNGARIAHGSDGAAGGPRPGIFILALSVLSVVVLTLFFYAILSS